VTAWGRGSPRLLAVIGVGVAALGGAGWAERRAAAPVLDLALLRDRVFVFANVSFVACMLALFAVGFLLPFYCEELRGFSTLQSGLLLTPLAFALAAVAPASGSLADRLGSRWLRPLGLGIATLGLVMLSALDQASPIPYIVACLLVAGLGQGIFQSPNSRTLMGAAPPQDQGVASGILATGRVIGQSLSVAVAGAVFATLGGAAAGRMLASSRQALSGAQLAALQNTFVSGLRAAFLVCAGLAALGVLATLVRAGPPHRRSGSRSEGDP